MGAGTYYLYNVGADRYLGFGQNWSARAIADHAGIPVTLAGNETYTIVTNVAKDGNGLKVDGYVDGTPANWSFTDAGITGKNVYYIHNGDSYLFYDASATQPKDVINVGANPNNANAQWQLVTKDERDAAFAAAKASVNAPLDITYKYIENPNTTWFTNVYTTSNSWTEGVSGANWSIKGGNKDWWDGKDNNGEVYNKNFDNYISISGVPNGVYEFGIMGFYRDGDSNQAIGNYHNNAFVGNVKVYANNDEISLQSIGISNNSTGEIYAGNDKSATVNETTYYIPNSQLGASLYFIRDKYPWQYVRTTVIDGNLKIGVKKSKTISTDWTVVDKFYLTLVDPYLSSISNGNAFTSGSTMEAGKWYSFAVPTDGDYKLSTTEGIVYSVEDMLLSTATTAATSTVALKAGTAYFKSATTQALTITYVEPVVQNGTYYLYDETNKVFLSRGNNYATRASVDSYGIPFTWNNYTKMIAFLDWNDTNMPQIRNRPHKMTQRSKR